MSTHTNTSTPILSASTRAVIEQRAKKLRSTKRACDRWFALCADLSAATRSGDEAAIATTTAAWLKGRCPAKSRTAWAYDDTAAILRVLGLSRADMPEGVAGTRAEWDFALDALASAA